MGGRGSNSSRREGFSLLELILALALITVVSSVAIPAYYSLPAVTLDNAAILLARDLRYAQNKAALIGEDTRVVFDEDGDGYRAVTESGSSLSNPVGGDALIRKYSADAVFEGTHIARLEGAAGFSLRFDRHGFALDQGRVELTYQDQVRILILKRGTGRVEIEGLSTHWRDDGL